MTHQVDADSPALPVIQRLRREDDAQRAAGLPSSQRTRNIDLETATFLLLLMNSLKPRRVLEIGSSNGLSTIFLALGVQPHGGVVIGTEVLDARAQEANDNLAQAGLQDVAQVLPGDALDTVRSVDGPFDVVFIDAEKDDYVSHFANCVDFVRSGGVILADNVVSHDLSAYQAMLRSRDDVGTVTLPIDRGIEFTVKR